VVCDHYSNIEGYLTQTHPLNSTYECYYDSKKHILRFSEYSNGESTMIAIITLNIAAVALWLMAYYKINEKKRNYNELNHT